MRKFILNTLALFFLVPAFWLFGGLFFGMFLLPAVLPPEALEHPELSENILQIKNGGWEIVFWKPIMLPVDFRIDFYEIWRSHEKKQPKIEKPKINKHADWLFVSDSNGESFTSKNPWYKNQGLEIGWQTKTFRNNGGYYSHKNLESGPYFAYTCAGRQGQSSSVSPIHENEYAQPRAID